MAQHGHNHHHHTGSSRTTIPVEGGGGNAGGQFGDTTLTKIFVGGLAWETKRDAMKRYFEQFGDILEAVVITDKYTGRSKGYGFVTFKDPESAQRACHDPTPVIDGRRANCNLAAIGAASNRSRPLAVQQQGGGGAERLRKTVGSAAAAPYYGSFSATAAATSYYHQHQHSQYGLPYSLYGYSGVYPHESLYHMAYYGLSGGGGHHHQFPAAPYYGSPATASSGVFYNFYHHYYGGSFGLQYPQVLQQYPYSAQQYAAGLLSLPSSVSAAATTGVSVTTGGGGPSSTSLRQPSAAERESTG